LTQGFDLIVRERRLLGMRGKASMNREQLMQSEKWQRLSSLINQFTQTL